MDKIRKQTDIELDEVEVYKNSHDKFWWKCEKEKDHEWEATVNDKGIGCPFCAQELEWRHRKQEDRDEEDAAAYLYPDNPEIWCPKCKSGLDCERHCCIEKS